MARVLSTAGDATLSVADPSSTNTGHLVNGAFFLPQKLQAGTGTTFAPVGGSAAPTAVKTWSAPTSNEDVAVNFKQSIGANDALRTGTLLEDADVHAVDDARRRPTPTPGARPRAPGAGSTAGSTLTSSVGPARRFAHSWQAASWASSIHASGRSGPA